MHVLRSLVSRRFLPFEGKHEVLVKTWERILVSSLINWSSRLVVLHRANNPVMLKKNVCYGNSSEKRTIGVHAMGRNDCRQ